MSNEVMSESLNFPAVKKRAVASRSYRVRIPPANGRDFVPGSTLQIDLPANLAGSFWDSTQAYLKFKVTNAAGGAACNLDRAGAYSFIRRQIIQSSGAMICDLDRYNALACAMLDTDSSLEWRGSVGKTLVGTETSLKGEILAVGESRTYCLPLILSPLNQTTPHRMIPLCSLAALQMRFTFEDTATAVQSAGAPVLSFSDCELVSMITELSPGAMAQIDAMTGRRYDILATSWAYSGGTLAAGVTQSTTNLGFSYSSLERVVFGFRPDASSGQGFYSLGNRATQHLSEYNLLINSQQYPALPIKREDKGAEALAELMIADHSLASFNVGNALTNGFKASGTGTTADQGAGFSMFANTNPAIEPAYPFNDAAPAGASAGEAALTNADVVPSTIGTFIASIELESAISNGRSSHIYSGVSTLASTVQLVTKHSAATASSKIDAWANFTVLLSLNMAGTGTWSISV